ncbi:MAG: response regulator [Anaerolineae bacterium]|nr:response regulator [Anaerolineae bacterium]
MRKSKLIILLVEDNPAHAEMVLRSFEQHNAASHIYHVSDGQAALDYLFRRGDYENPRASPRPNIVLLDLRLPKLSGLEVLREIKTTPDLKCIPVVILTTSEAEQDLARAYADRANSYLVKPVDFDKFVQLMHNLDMYWLGWNYTPCPDRRNATNVINKETQ